MPERGATGMQPRHEGLMRLKALSGHPKRVSGVSFGSVPKSFWKWCLFRPLKAACQKAPETKKALISQGLEYGGSVEIRTLG